MTEADIRNRFGNNVRRLRDKHGMSQLCLANRAGLAHNFINDIENGRKWVSSESMAKLCNALGEDPHQLFLPEQTSSVAEAAHLNAYIDEISEAIMQSLDRVSSRYRQNPADDVKAVSPILIPPGEN